MRLLAQKKGTAASFLLVALVIVGVPAYLFTHGIPKAFLIYLGTPVGEVRVRGVVERRHPYSPAFLAVKSGDPVYRNDVIYVGPGSEALVMFSGGRALEIAPSTLVELSQVETNSVETTVYLGQIRAGGGRAYSLRTNEIRGLEAPVLDLFKYLSGSKYAVAGKTRPIAMAALYDRLTGNSGSRPAPAAQPGATTKKTRAPSSLPRLPIPQITFVNPKRELVSVRKNRRSKLRWKEVMSGITYVVEVSPDKKFEKKVEERTKRTHTSLRLHKAGTYYVRVRTVVRGRWVSTPVRTFTVTE